VIGQLHTQAERIFGEELAVPDEQWQGGPQIASVCAVQSAVECGTVGKLNGWI